jgi:hypothetical protein
MSNLVSVCPEFWADLKSLRKKTKSPLLKSFYDTDDFESLEDEEKLESIKLLKAIKTYAKNILSINSLEEFRNDFRKYDRQPYLSQGWIIYKLRYAFDGKGKSGGLRIILCTNGNSILFVYISRKMDCADENQLEKAFMGRIQQFI